MFFGLYSGAVSWDRAGAGLQGLRASISCAATHKTRQLSEFFRGREIIMTTPIKFGTSGWRSIIADEFTFANVRRAVAGIAAYVKTQPLPHRVLVGRDPRFLGEQFVDEAARVLAAAGITPIVIPDAAPTPAIAYAVRQLKTSGAINFSGLVMRLFRRV